MKFAHLSDCHIGGWREDKLKRLSIESFRKAVEICINEKIDFMLISGDLFNTAYPSTDALEEVVHNLKKLKDENIRTYIIPGSHDYSPSGKTMINVLEKAGLCVNVFKLKDNKLEIFTDKGTGVKIAGMCGLKGGLEKFDYKRLDKSNLEREDGFKIFMFHSLLKEFLPKKWEMIECDDISIFPKGFDYYAGGHPHFVDSKSFKDYGMVAYPGPLFPNNIRELEELRCGGFYIVDEKLNIKHIEIKLKDAISLSFNADDKSISELQEEIIDKLESSDLNDKILTLRIEGMLKEGKTSDFDFKKINDYIKESYVFLKNTYKFSSKEYEENKIREGTVEDIENELINEFSSKIKFNNLNPSKVDELTKVLIKSLDKYKEEGETNIDFSNRIIKDSAEVFGIREVMKIVN